MEEFGPKFQPLQQAHASQIVSHILRMWRLMRRPFPVRERSGNFEQIEKVRENHIKYWKIREISNKSYLLFLVIFK